MPINPLAHDLNHILQHTMNMWEALRNQRIFITGGTGFFGCWLLESFAFANATLNLNAQAVVLTRNISAFKKKCPHLAHTASIIFHEGDVKDFTFPQGDFAYIIHAATDAMTQTNASNSTPLLDTIVQGTKRALEFAAHCHAKHFLLVSSGAVYGSQAPHSLYLTEESPWTPLPEDERFAYPIGKRIAEQLCEAHAKLHGLNVKIARCFAFVGPYLPLDGHFAIGNFIADALAGGPIRVNSDGTSQRSYLYAADLAIWLWAILFLGKPGRAYNVGSDESISVAELAQVIANTFQPALAVEILKMPQIGAIPSHYTPSIERAKTELQLTPTITLVDAINATKRWHAARQEKRAFI